MSMGGFEAARNHLAEDYVLGAKVASQLGKRVAVCQLPVYNVSQNRSVKDFFNRYLRWSVIHRTAISFPTYLGQGFLNFVPFGVLGFLAHPTVKAGVAVVLMAAYKIFLDVATARQFRQEKFGLRVIPAALLKDALIFAAWVNGLYDRNVVWRGNKLRVHHGSRLVPLEEPATSPSLEPANAWSEANDPDNRRAA
jgi:ceramide glucosyltransferase